MLNDPESARYTHTLTISLAGVYTCTVSNNKPSSDSASITVTGIYFTLNLHTSVIVLQISGPSPPIDVTGVQDGPNSIRVTWTPPSPLGDTTGYRIHYTNGGGSSGSQTVSGGNTMSHTLTGLTNGETYTMSIAATSEHFFSEITTVQVTLSEKEISRPCIENKSLCRVPSTCDCQNTSEPDSKTNSQSCEGDNVTTVIIGGVVVITVVLILSITTAVTVIIIKLANNHRKGGKDRTQSG